MNKVQNTFMHSRCLNPVVSRGEDSVNIGGGASIKLVDRFCYQGDMLNTDGSADAAVMVRIRTDRISLDNYPPF